MEALKSNDLRKQLKNKLTYSDVRNDSRVYIANITLAYRELSSSGYKNIDIAQLTKKYTVPCKKAIVDHGDLIGPTYNAQYVDQSSGGNENSKSNLTPDPVAHYNDSANPNTSQKPHKRDKRRRNRCCYTCCFNSNNLLLLVELGPL